MTIRKSALALLALSLASGAHASSGPDPQDKEPLIVNSGGTELTFDWPAFKIGTAEYPGGPTGVTVFHFPKKAYVAVDARGGGPSDVNAKHIELGYNEAELDAIVFSGGSWYGLESATAVGTAIKDDGLRDGHWDSIALTPGSIIYDLGPRRFNEIYPDKRLAQAAFRAAKPGVFRMGATGAGRMAKTGAVFNCRAHGGQGGAFRQIGDLKIAAFTVVNAFGAVVDRQGALAACYNDPAWPKGVKINDLMGGLPDSFGEGWSGQKLKSGNTTISLVVINQKLDRAQLARLAAQVHTSMSRALQPYATIVDGDMLYAVSTAEFDPPEGKEPFNSMQIGTIASEVMWDAVLASTPEQPKLVAPTPGLKIAAPVLSGYTGSYRFSSFVSIGVTAKDGKLYAQATGERDAYEITREAPVELKPVSNTLFTLPGRYPLTLSFAERGKLIVNPGQWQQTGTRQ